MAYYNPYLTGSFGIPCIANNQVLVTAQFKKKPSQSSWKFCSSLALSVPPILLMAEILHQLGCIVIETLMIYDNLIIYIVASRPSWCSCWNDDPPSKTAGNLHSSTLQAGFRPNSAQSSWLVTMQRLKDPWNTMDLTFQATHHRPSVIRPNGEKKIRVPISCFLLVHWGSSFL